MLYYFTPAPYFSFYRDGESSPCLTGRGGGGVLLGNAPELFILPLPLTSDALPTSLIEESL